MRNSINRRVFLQQSGLATGALAALGLLSPARPAQAQTGSAQPWYRRACRWGQTNITEPDPARYDIAWWRQYWKRTQVNGVIINAGGIFAYYPSRFPLHHRPDSLGGRDLYGELAKAAHDDGLFVLARMDSNRAHAAFYQAHPEWFAVDAAGHPYRAGELFVSCISSPYYEEYLPAVLREIIERSHPEGITDNSWSGLGRGSICYCPNCRKKFRDFSGLDLPEARNWDSPGYRRWIQWSYARRLEIWDLNNRATRAAGGPDCLWIGMNSGSITSQAASFRDYKAICERAEIIMLDHQSRSEASGFQHNSDAGKVIHGLLGWDKLIPESMAMYQAGRPTFRAASKPTAEARLWMMEGFAGGIQPWWHHVGAYLEDRRMFRTAEPLLRWHKANQQYLLNRTPLATIGVVWSQQNTDFYGRDNAEELVELPYRGIINSLIRARIPYVPLHIDHVPREAPKLAALILPNLAAMSDQQAANIRRFVENGGGLIATGETSLYDPWGDARPDFALADLFGAHLEAPQRRAGDSPQRKWAAQTQHSYLRLAPELRARVDGPHTGAEPPIRAERHPVLRGFDETDLLPYGGMVERLTLDPQTVVPLTLVPPFPIYPPETAWIREPKTDLAGLVLHSTGGARVAFLPADLDRRYGRDNLPDHGDLLANLVRWVSKDNLPLRVQGPGFIDCQIYRQPGRLILHLVNLTSAGARAPVEEFIPVGPLEFEIQLPQDVRGRRAEWLVSGRHAPLKAHRGWVRLTLASLLDHEVAVIT